MISLEYCHSLIITMNPLNLVQYALSRLMPLIKVSFTGAYLPIRKFTTYQQFKKSH
jgi:hypothetical protein